MTQHFGEMLHYCMYCDYGNNEKHRVDSHMLVKHGKGHMVSCPNENCDASFSSDFKLRKHMEYCAKGKDFICSYCEKSFKREQNMKHHIQVVHTNEIEKVQCPFCTKEYQSPAAYKLHFKGGNCPQQPSGDKEFDAV